MQQSLVCHRNLPVTNIALFGRFEPAALSLISAGMRLSLQIGRFVGIESGVVWAALRAVEGSSARSAAFAQLETPYLEETYSRLFKIPLPADFSLAQVEKNLMYNMLSVVAPGPDCDHSLLNGQTNVTPGRLIAAVLRLCDWCHACNFPFRRRGLDVRSICELLEAPGGYVPTEPIVCSQSCDGPNATVLQSALREASYVGSWIVRPVHVRAALHQLGEIYDPSAVLEWDAEIDSACAHVSGAGCTRLLAFPGPRPVTPSACELLASLG